MAAAPSAPHQLRQGEGVAAGELPCRGGHCPGDGANPELKENVLFSTSTETDGETRYSTKRKKNVVNRKLKIGLN